MSSTATNLAVKFFADEDRETAGGEPRNPIFIGDTALELGMVRIPSFFDPAEEDESFPPFVAPAFHVPSGEAVPPGFPADFGDGRTEIDSPDEPVSPQIERTVPFEHRTAPNGRFCAVPVEDAREAVPLAEVLKRHRAIEGVCGKCPPSPRILKLLGNIGDPAPGPEKQGGMEIARSAKPVARTSEPVCADVTVEHSLPEQSFPERGPARNVPTLFPLEPVRPEPARPEPPIIPHPSLVGNDGVSRTSRRTRVEGPFQQSIRIGKTVLFNEGQSRNIAAAVQTSGNDRPVKNVRFEPAGHTRGIAASGIFPLFPGESPSVPRVPHSVAPCPADVAQVVQPVTEQESVEIAVERRPAVRWEPRNGLRRLQGRRSRRPSYVFRDRAEDVFVRKQDAEQTTMAAVPVRATAKDRPTYPSSHDVEAGWPMLCEKLHGKAASHFGSLGDLLEQHAKRDRRIVAFCGCTPEAGATTLLLGVARELSRRERRILLVDLNLRNPELIEQFGLTTDQGWSEWFTPEAMERSDGVPPLLRLEPSGVSLLPLSRDSLDSASRFVEEFDVSAIIRHLLEWFDHILIDAGRMEERDLEGKIDLLDRFGTEGLLLIRNTQSEPPIDFYAAIEQIVPPCPVLLGVAENRTR